MARSRCQRAHAMLQPWARATSGPLTRRPCLTMYWTAWSARLSRSARVVDGVLARERVAHAQVGLHVPGLLGALQVVARRGDAPPERGGHFAAAHVPAARACDHHDCARRRDADLEPFALLVIEPHADRDDDAPLVVAALDDLQVARLLEASHMVVEVSTCRPMRAATSRKLAPRGRPRMASRTKARVPSTLTQRPPSTRGRPRRASPCGRGRA